MNPEKFIKMQHEIRQNQYEFNDFVKDLDSWTSEIKEEDKRLRQQPSDKKEESLPPVRHSLQKKRLKKVKKERPKTKTKSCTIKAYDFRAWDKFDVEKACELVDQSSGSSEYETDEEWEVQRKQLLANDLKEKGNAHLKAGHLVDAIECYSAAIENDPSNAVLPANRALALIKQEKYGSAEVDCNISLALDPTYVKAYHRRAVARAGLKRYQEAMTDFEQVLKLEPGNKAVKAELDKIHKILNPPKVFEGSGIEYDESCICSLVHKPPHLRSKKTPIRLNVAEINGESYQAKWKKQAEEVKQHQSKISKETENQHLESFEKYLLSDSVESKEQSNSVNSVVAAKTVNGDAYGAVNKAEVTRNGSSAANSSVTVGETANKASSEAPFKSSHPAPQNFLQFITVWRSLRSKPYEFFCYFKQIDAAHLPKLFGSSLEADIVVSILQCLQQFYLLNDLNPVPVLQNLLKVPRISVILMFLSTDEKQVLTSLFDLLMNNKKYNTDVIRKLSQSYESL